MGYSQIDDACTHTVAKLKAGIVASCPFDRFKAWTRNIATSILEVQQPHLSVEMIGTSTLVRSYIQQ